MVEPLPRQHAPVVEARRLVGRPLAEVPLAEDRRLVARLPQQLRVGGQAVVHVRRQGGDAVDVVVGAGEDGGPAGGADAVGAEAVVEAHALVGDAVEVGGAVDAAPVAAHGVGGVVVGHDEEDVGTGIHTKPLYLL